MKSTTHAHKLPTLDFIFVKSALTVQSRTVLENSFSILPAILLIYKTSKGISIIAEYAGSSNPHTSIISLKNSQDDLGAMP